MKKMFVIVGFLIGLRTTVHAQTYLKVTSDPVEKAKYLQKELKLSDEQTSQIALVYQDSAQKFDEIKIAEHGNIDKMTVAIVPLRIATIKKIKATLTKGQNLKYDSLVKESKSVSANGLTDGWSITADEN